MRYWVFQNNQVTGPYGREELANVASFSAESLVCPEGRRGTQMGDWQRAGVVAELAETLLKMARVPAGGSPDPGSSLLPPEPTLRDLAALGTLQEKVELLENSLSQLNEDVRHRDEEIAALKTAVDLKDQDAALLRDKLAALEVQIAELKPLADEVAALKGEASRQTMSLQELGGKVQSFSGVMEDSIRKLEAGQGQLKSDLEAEFEAKEKKLAEEIEFGSRQLREEIGSEIGKVSDKLQSVQAPAAAAPAPLPPLESPGAPSAPESGLGLPPEEHPALAPPAVLDAPAPVEPQATPPPFDVPPPAAEPLAAPPATLGLPSMAPPPVDVMPPVSEAPPAGESSPLSLDPIPQTAPGSGLDFLAATPPAPTQGPMDAPNSLFNEPAPGLADLGMPSLTPVPEDIGLTPSNPLVDLTRGAASGAKLQKSGEKPKEKKGKDKKGLIIALLVLGVLAGVIGGAYQGLYTLPVVSPLLGKKKVPPEPAKQEEPAPPPDAQSGVVDRAQEALESAKNYPIPRTGKTLAATLEGPEPQPGISPWTVSPGGGDQYTVKFYSAGPGGPKEEYIFDVQLDAGIIRGANAASQTVLNGEKPAAPAPPPAASDAGKKRKPRPRAAAGAKPAAKGQDLLSDPLSDLLDEPAPKEEEESAESEAAEPEQAPPPPQSKGRGKAGKSKEELTLDELLLPGMPAR